MTEVKIERSRRGASLLIGALLLAVGCADEPTLPPDAREDHATTEVSAFEARLTCTVVVSTGSMECGPASPGAAGQVSGPQLNLIVGN